MKPETTFIAERPAATHCPELFRRGPTPADLLAQFAGMGERMVRLLADRGHRVLVTGSPAEAPLTALVAGDAGEDLGGALDLPGLAGVLGGAGVVISGNTGPAHLAAAVRAIPLDGARPRIERVLLEGLPVPALRAASARAGLLVLGGRGAGCPTSTRRCAGCTSPRTSRPGTPPAAA